MITINGAITNNNMGSIRATHAADSARFNNRSGQHGCRRERHCNICKQLFTPEFKYQLFCGKCRTEDDSFIFNEWLPRVPEQVSMAAGF